MTISLSPQTQKLLEDELKTGEYESADDLVQKALQVLTAISADGLDEETLDAIDRAEDQIERGEVRDWEDVREEIRAKFLGK